ncbi:hypothetical protein [Microbulbifer epialgicus]|uniref:Uncharacterized protein n=1 Tax=Microbulbifer epialgicus TaxID=393907 RepID=A0ABV4P3R9_9GAMM
MSEDDINALEASIEDDLSNARHEESMNVTDMTQNITPVHALSFYSSISILAFGVIFVLIMACLINKGKNPGDVLRACGTILIVISAIYLIVAGYSEDQIAPVIGLLGTIAGYILGKSTPCDIDLKKTQLDKKSNPEG